MTAVAPSWLAEIAKTVEERIAALLDAETARWSALDPDLRPAFGALRAFTLEGGKRLRPAFCYWAFVGAGGDPTDATWVDAGAALELLQAFALMHDDVMDGSTTRRGRPAVHVAFEAEHTAGDWRGEARRFGEGAAILIGDLAFVYAGSLLRGAPPPALALWDELRLEVNVGQYLDMLASARGNPTVEQATRICTYKSGKYTIERPLHLGASLAGGDDPGLRAALSAYGIPLGEAFQLVDDVLGVFGDAAATGKPVGDDLVEGKPTRLAAIALERTAGTPDGDRLRAGFGNPSVDPDEVVEMVRIVEACGARTEVEGAARSLAATAVGAAAQLPLSTAARGALAELATFIVDRDR